jgi:hypothetical protein
MEYVHTFENFLNESLAKPGDEFEIAAVLIGTVASNEKTRLTPDLSNLGNYMGRGFYIGNKSTKDVKSAIAAFFNDPKELTDNFAVPPLSLHPDLGTKWNEKTITDYVNDMKRKGFSYYGSIANPRSGTVLSVLSKKRATLNTLQINKVLTPEDFWNDFYANYEG